MVTWPQVSGKDKIVHLMVNRKHRVRNELGTRYNLQRHALQ
jgi:hypothetical protein